MVSLCGWPNLIGVLMQMAEFDWCSFVDGQNRLKSLCRWPDFISVLVWMAGFDWCSYADG
jgi:hypothetical protein